LNNDGSFDYQYSSNSGETSWVSTLTFGLFDKKEPPGFDTREIYNPEWKNKQSYEELNRQDEEPEQQNDSKPWYYWLTFGLVG
jgi:outer membrane protein assembly factor BamD